MWGLKQRVSLKDYSTMRLGGEARYLKTVKKREQIPQLVAWAKAQNMPVVVVGQGSNIIWGDQGFSGLVIVNRIKRFETFSEDKTNVYITIGAGEQWDDVVERTVKQGLTGIEGLSYIPGTAGATPVQNVGAYGQEIAQTLVSIEAYDVQAKTFVNIPVIDCRLGYRTSRFKARDKGRFIITALTLHLQQGNPQAPFYPALDQYFKEHGITEVTPAVMREAVIAVRTSKLPDPKVVANNGSFFENPVVTAAQFADLHQKYSDIAHWELPDGQFKLSAAWLVDRAGFADYHDPVTGMGTWPKHALVLVNEHAKSAASLVEFRQQIITRVHYLFGVHLKQEPEFIEQ